MAFLGIRIPHETGRLLSQLDVPGEKTPLSEMHITLLYFGEEWPISELSKSLEAAYNVISKTKPFRAQMDEVTTFPRCEGDKCAVVSRVKSSALHEMRKALAKSFDKAGVEFSKEFKDYKPHVTLSYSEEEPDSFRFDPVDFSVQEVVLWGGDHGDDRIFVTFPLAGPEISKHSLLIQKATVFEKIAGNPPQDYFLSTTERRKVER